MPKIILEDVTKRWGGFYAVDHLNLVIDDASFVTLLGPSGCGKTTTLRMIAGLEEPTSGKITIGDTVVFDSEKGINVPANKRRVGFLFQNYALWPNMTVQQNIIFGLSNIKEEMPIYNFKAKNARRIAEILEDPKHLADIIEDCRDKKGKIDEKRMFIRIIDEYEISMYTAKELYGLKIHENQENAKKQRENYLAKEKQYIGESEAKGYKVNKDYALTKDGKLVKEVRKLTDEETDLTLRRVSRIVKIGMFMDRYPAELSGGQQQRVAIARTLAPQPKVMFMDEPLSNLDAKLRLEMRTELQRLHHTTGSTFVYVTHDQLEAMTLATKICLIENGVLQQYDPPLKVYNNPNNLFVADFVGNPAVNFIEANGELKNGKMEFKVFDKVHGEFSFNDKVDMKKFREDEQKEMDREAKRLEDMKHSKKDVEKTNKNVVFKYHIARADDKEIEEQEPTLNDYVLGVRPEFIEITNKGGIPGEIYSAMPTGMETTVRVKVGNYILTSVVFGGITYELGEKVRVNIKGKNVMLFSRKSGNIIDIGSFKFK